MREKIHGSVLLVCEAQNIGEALEAMLVPACRVAWVRDLPQALGALAEEHAVRPVVVLHTDTTAQAATLLTTLQDATAPFLSLAICSNGDSAVPADDVLIAPGDPREVTGRVQLMLRLAAREAQLFILRRYVAAPLFHRVRGLQIDAPPTRQRLSILFGDLRGFTDASSFCAADEMVGLLNDYLAAATRLITARGGIVDKFTGDGVCAYFGFGPEPDAAIRAVQAALDLQVCLEELKVIWFARGILPIGAGIGVTTGDVTLGSIGSRERADFTIIGSVVNLAARLQAYARGGEVVIDDATHAESDNRFAVRPSLQIQVKGFEQPVTVYTVLRN